MKETPEFDKLIGQLEDLELTTVHGRITEIVGMLIKAVVPQVKMGGSVSLSSGGTLWCWAII